MNEALFTQVVNTLKELENDSTVPRNIKARIRSIIINLEQKEETSIKINRAMHELEEIADDSNMQAYTRTQIFNIVSSLEIIH